MARVLVVYYSRTGHTRKVAETLASLGGWDLEALIDRRLRAGLIGYLRSGLDAALGRVTDIVPLARAVAAYDLVIVGTPIWNGSVSAAVRTFLGGHRRELRAVAFFLTCGGRGAARVFRQMRTLAGHGPVATLALREAEVLRGAPDYQGFVAAIQRWLGREAPSPAPSEPPIAGAP